ncbi:uncharacterized protein LOC130957695 [Arachis stenosperma]|uniref:uncharacterized protein LOC130957695 n=1 Tax=Arachis stenosperma TaxID=217475 RepID=UPI0025AB72DF|nr:uncharacterized protein LOC130957695 [Arachis stenosperma]
MDEMNFDLCLLKEELENNLHTMNLEQHEPFDKVISAVNDDVGGFFFNFVYPNLFLNLNNELYFRDRTILAPTLEIVNDVNKHIMKSLIGEEKTYLSSDSLCAGEGNMESKLGTVTPNVLNAINCSGLLSHLLTLKESIPVMLLRNID